MYLGASVYGNEKTKLKNTTALKDRAEEVGITVKGNRGERSVEG